VTSFIDDPNLLLLLLLNISCASAPFHLHFRQLPEDHVPVLVHVEEVDAGHLLWRAARAEVRLLDQVAVSIGWHDHAQAAVAGAKVGLVLGGVDDEGPAVLLLEVDGEGPEAAVCLGGVGLL
jgi:hypothetical protein